MPESNKEKKPDFSHEASWQYKMIEEDLCAECMASLPRILLGKADDEEIAFRQAHQHTCKSRILSRILMRSRHAAKLSEENRRLYYLYEIRLECTPLQEVLDQAFLQIMEPAKTSEKGDG